MDVETVRELRDLVAKPELHEVGQDRAFVTLPPEFRVEDVSKLLPPPERIQQRPKLLTAASFCDYVKEFATGATAVFADEQAAKYVAVLDYHAGPGILAKRGACDHVAAYECPKSDQWNTWLGLNGKMLDQVAFAQFLQANLRDVMEPAPADLLKIALELQVHKSANFQSEVRLDNGQTVFRYEEQIRGSAKGGDIEIPSQFTIGIPVFFGDQAFRLDALFKYRMAEGKLTLGFEILRPLDVYRAAVTAVTAHMRKQLADVRFYVGAL